MKTEKNLVPQSLSALVPSREKVAFTKPSRGTSVSERRTIISENRIFRFNCERCRLMRGAVDIKNRKVAFTLAEVLITLAVVGVVAILVMPKLLDNVADRKYDAARKKALASIGEAVKQITIEGDITSAVDAEDFVKNYLSKKLSIIKTCDSANLKECGLETASGKIKNFEGIAKITLPKNWNSLIGSYSASRAKIDPNATSYGFVMSNGYSVNLFYNPNCTYINPKSHIWAATEEVCVHATYDMNGLAGPNQYFKDIGFVTVLYPTMNSIAISPKLYKTNVASADWDSAVQICADMGARLLSATEYASLSISGCSSGVFSGNNWNWSGTLHKNGNNTYPLALYCGWQAVQTSNKGDSRGVTCVKD